MNLREADKYIVRNAKRDDVTNPCIQRCPFVFGHGAIRMTAMMPEADHSDD